MDKKWGFLRETKEQAIKAGIDKDTGLHRNGLEEYLSFIFPDTNDWVHDKITGLHNIDGKLCRRRPDWRSDSLKLIIEFDGIDHYRKPDQIIKDIEANKFYESHGYKVVRIPYFIQLTNDAVEKLFGVKVKEPLFDVTIPSIGPDGRNTPAYLCPLGIKRMAKEFVAFPNQYKTNIDYLRNCKEDELLNGYQYLEEEYNKIVNNG